MDYLKVLLDKYLELVPDPPYTENIIPSAKTVYGIPSNNINGYWASIPD